VEWSLRAAACGGAVPSAQSLGDGQRLLRALAGARNDSAKGVRHYSASNVSFNPRFGLSIQKLSIESFSALS